MKIEFLLRLNRPPSRFEHCVDLLAGLFLGVLI